MKHLLSLFIFLFLGSLFLSAEETEHIQFAKKYQTAHLIEAGKFEITLNAGAMNDMLDLFNFKKKIASSEKINLAEFNDFGDWQSYETLINLGLHRRVNLRLTYGLDLIEIGKSQAKIQHYGFELKTLLLEEQKNIPAVTLSLKYDTHIANNIKGSIHSLNFSTNDMDITQTFNPPETLTVGGLNDQNIHAGIHFGKVITESFMFYSFHKYIHTSVNSEFKSSLDVTQFQKLQNDFSYTANVYNAGLGFYYTINDAWLLTSEYNFYYFSRKFNESSFAGHKENKAHTFDMAISYFFNATWGITLGGTIDANFLAAEIPSMFNKRSASKFDNPYGQIYLSLTFGFNIVK